MRAIGVRQSQRAGLTLIELVVVIAIFGILMGLLLPAINAARQAARLVQCKSNLRQVGLGLHSYVDVHGVFPPTSNNTSWTVAITPFVEQRELFNLYNHSLAYDAPVNIPVGEARLQIFSCPEERELRISPTGLVAANVALNLELSGLAPGAVTDGLSNTGLVVETTSDQAAPWSAGPAIILGPQRLPHRTVLNIVRADGSVFGIPESRLDLLPAMGSPNGGEVIDRW